VLAVDFDGAGYAHVDVASLLGAAPMAGAIFRWLHPHQDRQSLVPCDGHHRTPVRRRQAEYRAPIANHDSARVAGIYDRHNEQVNLDEIERIVI
jgi:hypothetical protein